MSLGIATRPSLPLARRVAPGAVVSAGSCRRLHYVPAVVVATPTLPGRHVVVRVTAASCRRSRCRPFVAVASSSVSPPLPSPALAATAHRPLARRRRGSRRCVAVSSRRRRPSRSRPSSVRASPPSARSPSSSSRAPRSPLVVCASSPPRRRRSSSSSRAAFAVIVAAVLVVNTLGHGSRCRCVVVRVVSVVISVLAAIAGYHRLVVTVCARRRRCRR